MNPATRALIIATVTLAGLPAVWPQNALSMADAVSLALSTRHQLQAAHERLTASQQLESQAKLLPNPRLYLQSEDLRASNFSFSRDSETYAYFSELIETSGKRQARTGAAAQDVNLNRAAADVVRARVAAGVRHAYWAAQSTALLAKLYDEHAEYYRQLIAYHQARFNEGKLAEVDFLRIKLEGERVQASAAEMQLTSEHAMLQLASEMGLPEGNWKLTEPFEELEQPKPLPQAAEQASLRPEAAEARFALESARANTSLQKSLGRPDVELLGGYKANLGENTAIVGLQMNLPLFNRNQGAVGAAVGNAHAAEQDYAVVSLQLSTELKLAQRDYEFRQNAYQKTFLPLHARAIEISDITRAAYREGGMDLVRLLDAEQLRVDADLSWVNALENYHQSVVSLEYAEGVQP
jgi:outer membrane protein TolC